jgi:O-antigen/teichoic acid export membrane protein
VQQEQDEQEHEFQHAFTLELGFSALMAMAICALAPLVGLLYRDERLTVLMLALAYLPLAFAMQAPLWIFFRRMDYARQRSLQAIQPLVSFCVTIPLAATTSLGVWSLVVGQVAGYAAAVTAGLVASPYRLALRYDRTVAARYLRFSTPILVSVLATMIIAQGQMLAFKLNDGLAAAGFLTLAVTLTRYIDRADQVITATIYPAICAVQGRTRVLQELFVKSNRATLMWVLPFAGGIVLFAPDLVHFVLGRRWDPAIVLLQGLAVAGAITHLGFNWFSFYRAHGNTGPPAVEAVVAAVAFLALAVPGLLLAGAEGFVAGRVAGALAALAVRTFYVRRLMPGVRYRPLVAPAIVPLTLAAAVVLAVRLIAWGGARPAWQAIVEVALFTGVFALVALRRERPLVAELVGALRHREVELGAEVTPAGGPGRGEQGAS